MIKRDRLPTAKRRQIRRQELWVQQDGKCFWCQSPTLLALWCVETHETPPDNLATLEHLLHSRDPRRRVPPVGGEQRLAMACYRCNQDRGARDELRLRKKGRVDIDNQQPGEQS